MPAKIGNWSPTPTGEVAAVGSVVRPVNRRVRKATGPPDCAKAAEFEIRLLAVVLEASINLGCVVGDAAA